MRRYPLCWGCTKEVDTDPIYESLCGHDDTCPTSVWHGLCLMRWREEREEAFRKVREFIASHPSFQRPPEEN